VTAWIVTSHGEVHGRRRTLREARVVAACVDPAVFLQRRTDARGSFYWCSRTSIEVRREADCATCDQSVAGHEPA